MILDIQSKIVRYKDIVILGRLYSPKCEQSSAVISARGQCISVGVFDGY
jgi:hypothetical protein